MKWFPLSFRLPFSHTQTKRPFFPFVSPIKQWTYFFLYYRLCSSHALLRFWSIVSSFCVVAVPDIFFLKSKVVLAPFLVCLLPVGWDWKKKNSKTDNSLLFKDNSSTGRTTWELQQAPGKREWELYSLLLKNWSRFSVSFPVYDKCGYCAKKVPSHSLHSEESVAIIFSCQNLAHVFSLLGGDHHYKNKSTSLIEEIFRIEIKSPLCLFLSDSKISKWL